MNRAREFYEKEIVPAMMEKFSYKNKMAVPKIDKVVVNVGLGEAKENAKVIDAAVSDITIVTGQKPIVTKAKKSVANFKLRQGMPIGVKATLRGEKMYSFLDRVINVALPRVRDFQGVSGEAFDGRGNYTLGIREQIIFPEISYE
ncbi:MAG: 50S ribosomal protein L5, partial [Defluviitaleaceae bacterium]|nr:50S ribosomal protein L5 [Defluviitaleaceae bacterium]